MDVTAPVMAGGKSMWMKSEGEKPPLRVRQRRARHVWYYEKNNRLLFIGDEIPTQTEIRALRERHEAEPEIILPGHGKPARLPNLVF